MIYESSNAFSFGHEKKDFSKTLLNPETLKTPIVGKYTQSIINKPSRGFIFNKEKKLKQNRPKTPGPGKYNVDNKSFGKDTPKYSMGKRPKEIKVDKEKSLGPGSYNVTIENYEKTIGKSSISRHFGKDKRLKYKDNKVPGVGKYEVTTYYDLGKNKKNQFTIPKSSRSIQVIKTEENKNAKKTDNQTGKKNNKNIPKFYQIKPLFGNEGTRPTIRGKPKELKRVKTPGPGQYNVDVAFRKTLKNVPSVSFGLGKKLDFTETAKKKNVPGPIYDVNSGFNVKDKNKIHSIKYIKTPKKKDKRFKTPGPGSYYIPCSFANTPSYQSINNKFRKV